MSTSVSNPSGARSEPAAAPVSAIGLVDFGSTFTKVRAVTPAGELVGHSQHPTTADTDIFDGLKAAAEQLEGIDLSRFLACSSAGGGLRMGVVGLVAELTSEAARQAALSAGARVVSVVSGGLSTEAEASELLEQKPDMILLVGGTDGGDRDVLCATARVLTTIRAHIPIVVAGNRDAQEEAVAALRAGGHHVAVAPNVMPAIGTISPEGVREVVRELFITHVIGGKVAGAGPQLERLVKMATPDAVLRGTELLAQVLADRGQPDGVVVVDVGGATTDVHSVVRLPGEADGYKRELLPHARSVRSVEADLGVRWNATGVIEAALAERLIDEPEAAALAQPAARRVAEPAFLSDSPREVEIDRRLASLAVSIALRRHVGRRRVTLTPEGVVLARDGRDLTPAAFLLGTGGVFRVVGREGMEQCLERAGQDRQDRLLPHTVRTEIDERYVLAAVGLLALEDQGAARALLETEFASLLMREGV
jgi:uncharacterized protein (TIGR01319 family)